MPNEHHDSLSLRFVLSVLQRELSDLDSRQDVGSSINVDIVNCIDQVTDLIGLRQSQLNSFTSHAKHTNCALWVLLRLRLSDNGGCIDLTVPSGRSEISIPVPF